MMNEKAELMIEILTQTALKFMVHCVMFMTNGTKNRFMKQQNSKPLILNNANYVCLH